MLLFYGKIFIRKFISRNSQTLTPKSFIKANSQMEFQRYASGNPKKLSRLESLKGKIIKYTMHAAWFCKLWFTWLPTFQNVSFDNL